MSLREHGGVLLLLVLMFFYEYLYGCVRVCFSCRYPRACHLICLRVPVEKDNVTAGTTAPTDAGGSGGALTPSKGKGRAMHGERMVEWLEVSTAKRYGRVFDFTPRLFLRLLLDCVVLDAKLYPVFWMVLPFSVARPGLSSEQLPYSFVHAVVLPVVAW